jgi:hypothetical protein
MRARSPRSAPRQAVRDERGFILVGVVTFMLALTILGLSLFALSSYEAQFFHSSAAREQSLQNCESGMSLVQALLETRFPRNLENARLAVGQFGITRAIAYQHQGSPVNDTASTGPVDWADTLYIEVSAKSGSAERTVRAAYTPVTNANPYQRLITTGKGIDVNTINSTNPATFHMSGRVWQHVQSASDTAWTRALEWTSGRPVDPTPTPTPLADAFVDARLAGELSVPTLWMEEVESQPGNEHWKMEFLNADQEEPAFFRSPPSPGGQSESQPEFAAYTFYTFLSTDITVRGTVVWVVPDGICFRRTVSVQGHDLESENNLVIVARRNGRHPGYEDRGIWFQGGIHLTPNSEGRYPRVYLVSEGDIGLTHHHSYQTSKRAPGMSIVAGGRVELGGPEGGEHYELGYTASVMDALAERLLGDGALPNYAGGSATAFAVLRGQWAETTLR